MTSPNSAIKSTYQDYISASVDQRYELLAGALILLPVPRREHQRVQARLGSRLHLFVDENELGVVYFAPHDVVFSNTDVVQPDLMFISNERMHIDTEAKVWGGPDLVVEILCASTAERDRTVKRALYARHGVIEYWLVDPKARTVEVLGVGDQGFEPVDTFGGERHWSRRCCRDSASAWMMSSSLACIGTTISAGARSVSRVPPP